MKVIAIKHGFFGKLREPGDEFEVPDGERSSWFEPSGDEEFTKRRYKPRKVSTEAGEEEQPA